MNPSFKTLMVAGAALLFVSAAGAVRAASVDTKPLAQAVESRAVRFGDRGDAVKALQSLLGDAGFDPGPLDGIFGPLTEGAVKRAQTALGLTVDGLAGRLTLEALLQATSSSGPAPASALAPELSKAAGSEVTPPSAPPAVATLTGPIEPDGELVLHAPKASAPLVGAIPTMATPLPAAKGQPFALTFNGTPDPTKIDAMLGALAQHQMKATFFISGEEARQNPSLVAQIAAAGHEIGNAGLGSFAMTQITRPMMDAQLTQAQNAIKAVTGQAPRYFRPPQAQWNADLLTAAKGVGLQSVLWSNITAQDIPGISAEELSTKLSSSVYPAAVVMLHADREGTVHALDRVLTALEVKGFTSSTLSDLAAVAGQTAFDTSLLDSDK